MLVQRYDLYLGCCPYCGHNHLIRWGYYGRQGLPIISKINIQRVRCKQCGRTSNVLPSFLLSYKRYAVTALKELIITYINHPDDWRQALKLMIDLSTAYRWLRSFSDQANRSLPDIRTALLKLKPDYPLTRQLNSKPAALMSQRDLLKRFIRLSQQLFKAAVRLIDSKTPVNSDPFCFLNYFLVTSTGKPLLQG